MSSKLGVLEEDGDDPPLSAVENEVSLSFGAGGSASVAPQSSSGAGLPGGSSIKRTGTTGTIRDLPDHALGILALLVLFLRTNGKTIYDNARRGERGIGDVRYVTSSLTKNQCSTYD